jgi:hypothetical protein
MADVLDALRDPTTNELPEAVIISELVTAAEQIRAAEFAEWLKDRKNRRLIPQRLADCDYIPVRNPDATDELWRVDGRRQAVYCLRNLSFSTQVRAVRKLIEAA